MNRTANQVQSTALSRESSRRKPTVVFVAPDCTDSAVQRRAHGLIDSGCDVVSFSFRRTRYNVDFEPDWPNIELGKTIERRLLTRLFVFLRSLWRFFRHRRTWRSASMVYARNLDLALLALIGKAVTRCSAPLVYEVLDIHPALAKQGLPGSILRWLERRVLANSKLLVVSSPAFLRNYFLPTQRYRGDSFLLENKWPASQMSRLSRKLAYEVGQVDPEWTIGWFGNIRCQQSLEILRDLADALPTRVRIYLRGCVSLVGEQNLMNVIGNRKNMIFDGEYSAPGEFPEIYSQVHFNWCVDLCGGENSLWLLPNRLYEGGYFGIPALAIGSHETGSVVRQRQLGIALETPVVGHLADLLSRMTRQEYQQMRQRIESLPETNFVDDGDTASLVQKVLVNGIGNPAVPPAEEFQAKEIGVEQNR